MRKKLNFENLDCLRFLCFLSVFLFHSFTTRYDYIRESGVYHFVKYRLFLNGNIGVNFFFVLSGFLITYLLIEEKKMNNRIDVPRFWIRRILRIWPVYYLCVFIGFVVFPYLKQKFGQVPNETATPLYYLTFTNNFEFIRKGLPDSSLLGVLWSVAVEEQFYLVWPLVLALVPLRKYWIPFSVVIAGSLIFRILNDNPADQEFHTLSCIGDMSIGALGAWAVSEFEVIKERIKQMSKIQIALIYILFFVAYFGRSVLLEPVFILRIFERVILAVLILGIILEQNFSENSFFKLVKFKTGTRLGTVSYGLYCYHFLGILITITLTNKFGLNKHLWQVLFLETPMAFILSVIISQLSYKFIETPFLNLKKRFQFVLKE